MKFILSFLIFLTAFLMVSAERIDGPANIRQTPKGEMIFSLNDNVEVETSEMENDWYEILISIQITREQYDAYPLILKKGTKLYNRKGKEIGVFESSIDDPSPLDRVRLIFDGETLIAIVHSRNLDLKGYETVPIQRERKLTHTHRFECGTKTHVHRKQ